MVRRTVRAATPALLLAAAAVLTACGGGSSDSAFNGSSGGTGSVGIMLTDAPTADYDHIYVTITGITLLGEGGHNPVLFDGTRTVDLMALSSTSDLFTVRDKIPAGDYSKIRLDVSDVELVDTSATPQTVHAKLPSGHIDVNPRGPFSVTAGQTLIVQLDADAEKSTLVTTAGASGQTIFRPVMFADILHGTGGGRLVRVHGIAADEGSDGRFALCPTDVVSTGDEDNDFGDSEPCVQVTTDTGIGVFGKDGRPDDAGINAINTGDELTAIGFLTREESSGGANADLGGSTSSGDRGDLFDGDYSLDATVVELGKVADFDRVAGTVDSRVASGDTFDLQWNTDQNLTDGSGGALANPVPVQLFPETHIYTRDGTAREKGYIDAGQSAVVDSVVNGAGDALNASLVVLGTAPQTGIPGTLASVSPANDTFSMDVTQDTAGGPSADQRIVVGVNADTRIVLVDGSDVSMVDLGDLSGLSTDGVTVYGNYDNTLSPPIVADTVVVIAR